MRSPEGEAWWRMQSCETSLQVKNRELFPDSAKEQARSAYKNVVRIEISSAFNQLHESSGTFLLFRRTGGSDCAGTGN